MRPRHDIRGFSILELSIVFAIIGLLIGGVLTGQNLLRTAMLRKIGAEEQRYVNAVRQFADKYAELPGDMSGATNVWDVAHATPATCATTNSATLANPKLTCNGDGDGLVETQAATSNVAEIFRFWQHLANAGMVEGLFSGVAGSAGTSDAIINTNIPVGPVDGSGYAAIYVGTKSAQAGWFDGDYGHVIFFGRKRAGNFFPEAVAITPSEARSIDQKLDDGKPALGSVRTFKNQWYANCATTDVANTAVYSTTYEDVGCQLLFINAF